MTKPIETCETVLDTIHRYNKTPESVFEYTSCLEWAAKCEEKADVYITAPYYPAVFTQEVCRTAVPAGHLKLFLERIGQPVPVPVAPSAAPAPSTAAPSAEPAPAAPATEAPPAPASAAPAPKTGGGTGKADKKDKRKSKDLTVDLNAE